MYIMTRITSWFVEYKDYTLSSGYVAEIHRHGLGPSVGEVYP